MLLCVSLWSGEEANVLLRAWDSVLEQAPPTATASELNSATFLELVALMGSNKKAQVTVMTTFTATYKLMQLVEAVQYFEDTRGGVDWFALGKEARSGWLRDAGHESSHRQKRSRARAHGDSEGRGLSSCTPKDIQKRIIRESRASKRRGRKLKKSLYTTASANREAVTSAKEVAGPALRSTSPRAAADVGSSALNEPEPPAAAVMQMEDLPTLPITAARSPMRLSRPPFSSPSCCACQVSSVRSVFPIRVWHFRTSLLGNQRPASPCQISGWTAPVR